MIRYMIISTRMCHLGEPNNSMAKKSPSAVDWNDEIYRLPGDLLIAYSVYTLRRLLPFLEEGNFR
jgi:hypothetical protein